MKAASITRSRFPPINRAQWLDAGRALQPAPARVGRRGAEAGSASAAATLSGRSTRWRIVQRIDDPDPIRANLQALDDLEHGADGLALVFENAPNAFGRGLPANADALERALDGVPLGRAHLRIDAHPASRASVDWLVAILASRRVDPQRLSLSFGFDPAAVFAGTGRLNMSIEALQASLPQSLAHFFAMGLPAVLLECDGRVAHNAGATEAQELGIVLASAVSHLRMFEEARQPLVYAAPHIGFSVSVDQDQFMSIIKIRALRWLWDRAQETCSITPSPAAIHAESSYRMLTAANPPINALRTAFAGLGAIVGGADTISLLPATIYRESPDPEARRHALDSQLILARESYAALVSEPGPTLTGLDPQQAALCEAAWEEFRRIEAEGGILRSLAEGRIQERVAEARAEKARRRGDREDLPVRDALPDRLFPDLGADAGAVHCTALEPALLEQYELAEEA